MSEINNWNVLLLEAGRDATDIYDIPALAANLQLTSIDWKYKTERNNSYCRGKRYQLISNYDKLDCRFQIFVHIIQKVKPGHYTDIPAVH